MDKKIIQHNNEVKFETNKIKDEKLRQFDNKLASIMKKIEKLAQKKFINQRKINDSNKDRQKSPTYAKKNYMHKLFYIIKIILLNTLINLYKHKKKLLEKNIFELTR